MKTIYFTTKISSRERLAVKTNLKASGGMLLFQYEISDGADYTPRITYRLKENTLYRDFVRLDSEPQCLYYPAPQFMNALYIIRKQISSCIRKQQKLLQKEKAIALPPIGKNCSTALLAVEFLSYLHRNEKRTRCLPSTQFEINFLDDTMPVAGTGRSLTLQNTFQQIRHFATRVSVF